MTTFVKRGLLLYLLFAASCKGSDETIHLIEIDTSISKEVKKNITLTSDRAFSVFQTNVDAQFYSNDILTDSINQKNYSLFSWYTSHKDTTDLVVHVNDFETEALLLRFIKDSISVMFYRCAHTSRKAFKLKQTDSLSHCIEVLPKKVKLSLSEIPDSVSKPIIYGKIELESNNFYEIRNSIESKRRTNMKFYFRSQFRKSPY